MEQSSQNTQGAQIPSWILLIIDWYGPELARQLAEDALQVEDPDLSPEQAQLILRELA